MITKFDSLFAGHVDVENVGYAGTPVNDRDYSDEYLATAFDKSLAIAQLMDRKGYDTLWLAEHHFQPEGFECIPNVLMLSVHLAHQTERINFGCGFNITPMWHPLRLAEDFATADIFTKGGVIFGVGRGYHTREVETFGAPLLDQGANRDLFEEQVDVIFKALTERPFSHKGEYYELPPEVPYRGYDLKELTLVPRPIYRPLECWQPIQGATPRGLDFMVKHGIKGLIGGGVAEGGAMDNTVVAWQQAHATGGESEDVGRRPEHRVPLLPVRTRWRRESSGTPGFMRRTSRCSARCGWCGRCPTSRLSRWETRPLRPRRALPTMAQAIEAGAVLCGPPSRVVDQLKGLEKRLPGLERVSMSQPVGTPQSVILEQLEWFAEDVMPAFVGR